MKIIAVAGGSGMGKTLFTKMLGERLPKSVVLPMDQYYFDKPDDTVSYTHLTLPTSCCV